MQEKFNQEGEGAVKEKLVVIHPDASDKSKGGSQTNAIEITNKLSNYFDVSIFSPNTLSIEHHVKFFGLSRTKIGLISKKLKIDFLLKKIFENPYQSLEHLVCFIPIFLKLLRSRPKVLYPNYGYGGLRVCCFYRNFFKCLVVYTEHAGLLHGGKTIRKNLRSTPDLLVVFDEQTKQFVNDYFPSIDTVVIPNGIDIKTFTHSKVQPDKYFDNDEKVILVVGRLERKSHKRIELAIAAVAKMKKKCNLLICGEGAHLQHYMEMGIEQVGEEHFKIISVNFEKMPQLYKSVDLFTLPSLNEPFGKVYVEAMASGLGIVATEDSMRTQLIGNAGILCDVENINEYASSLDAAIDLDYSLEATKQAIKFDWNQVARKYSDEIKRKLTELR